MFHLLCRKFEAAKALWLIIQSSNLVGDDKLGVCAIAHEFWGFPWLLRSHCVTGLLDWAMNHVAGAQSQGSKVIKAQKMGNKEINLPIDEVSWEILAHILNEENLLPNGYAIPSSVLVGIATQLKDVNARRHTVISNVARVMRALNTFKQQRNGKNVRTSWRLDHCVALATAALSMSDRSVCEKHRVAYNAVILLEGQTQSAVNLRKVWDALVPHHLPVFLIGAFSPALQWNEPLQTACRRVLKEILFAPEHLDSLQEAFDIEPERRSAIKTASYATQLLIQIDQLLGGDESLESTESVFLSLSWFLDEFSTAYNACSMTLKDKRGLLDPDSNREDETKGDSSRSKSDINPAFRCFETFSRSLMSIWMDRRAKDSDYDGELLLR